MPGVIVNETAYREFHAPTNWSDSVVDTWFLNIGDVGTLEPQGGTEQLLHSFQSALVDTAARCEDLKLGMLGISFKDRRRERTTWYRTIAEGYPGVLEALAHPVSRDPRDLRLVSIGLDFPIDVKTRSGLGTKPARFSLDLALAGFEPGTPDFAVLTLSSECWSVLRTDNRRDIALAYLADQGLLRQGEESRDELQEILRLGNLQAMQDAVRSKGSLPVEATRLEFSRQCVLILGDSQQLSSNEELSVLNRDKVSRLTEPIAAALGGEWRFGYTSE